MRKASVKAANFARETRKNIFAGPAVVVLWESRETNVVNVGVEREPGRSSDVGMAGEGNVVVGISAVAMPALPDPSEAGSSSV